MRNKVLNRQKMSNSTILYINRKMCRFSISLRKNEGDDNFIRFRKCFFLYSGIKSQIYVFLAHENVRERKKKGQSKVLLCKIPPLHLRLRKSVYYLNERTHSMNISKVKVF